MIEFTKVKMETTKGTQPSKWDFIDGQLEPGEAAEFDPDVVSKSSAAIGAARLRKLSGKPYHSGYNTISKKTFIRLRPNGEIPSQEEKEEEVVEAGEDE